MAVHCSSNVILLAIEYFIDSKGERQNIKLSSTQNNHSPSFGLKKLLISFISSDKTDKKLCPSWKYKTRCRTKRRGGQGMALIKGQVGPRAQLPRKAQEPPKCLAFEIKENTENIAEYRRKKTCFKSFFILIIFLFSAKSGGGGPKKWWGHGPSSPSPFAVPALNDLWLVLYEKCFTIPGAICRYAMCIMHDQVFTYYAVTLILSI